MPLSPADKARRVRRLLDENRAAVGNDRGRQAADQQVRPSHGDPPRSENTPNTNRAARP